MDLRQRITEYLDNGGQAKDEPSEHGSLRDLLIDVRDHLDALSAAIKWLEPPFIHSQTSASEIRLNITLLLMEVNRDRDNKDLSDE